jgi:EAL domain-containing protein (putative c-di-GMP-specific phosphodiesterase class I)
MLGAERQATAGPRRLSLAVDSVFQPVYRLGDGALAGVEALAPLDDTAPGLELAAARTALACVGDLPPGIFLSVRLSPGTLWSSEPAEALEPGEPGRLVVEVDPTGAADQDELALARLRRRGVRLAVVYAGVRGITASDLVRFAPELIKLDPTLVDGIRHDRWRRAFVGSLVSFAETFDASLFAGGIEETMDLQVLRSLGVRYGSGPLLGPPVPFRALKTSTSSSARAARSE